MANLDDDFKRVVSHAKEYGFVVQSSEIYDGLSAVYDYTQNGAELKRNIREYWWKAMVQFHDNIVGIDAAILMHPTTWKASGHVDAFNDPLIDNKDSKKRYRADVLIEDHVAKIEGKIAKEVADEFTKREPNKPRFVAGSIGPTNKTASMSPEVNDPGFRAVTFDDLRIAYKQQVEALIDGGVDLLLVETIFDTLNAKACLFAIDEVQEKRGTNLPIMVSGTITDASGRTLSGQTAEAFLISVSHAPLLSVGFNCALGADLMKPYLKTVAQNTDFFTSAHPNAGLPNEFGEYDETPEMMAHQIKEFLDEGLINIIGGCCGTTPAHIKAIADLAHGYEPRKVGFDSALPAKGTHASQSRSN